MKRQLVVLLFLILCSACLGDISEPTDPVTDGGGSDQTHGEPNQSEDAGRTDDTDPSSTNDANNSRGDPGNDSASDQDWDAGTHTDTDDDHDNGNAEDAGSDIDPGADQETPCNPNSEPTWDDTIDPIMRTRCTRCHWEASSYDTIQVWVDNGKLAAYTSKNHFWGELKNAQTTRRWVEIGAPKTDCDVP